MTRVLDPRQAAEMIRQLETLRQRNPRVTAAIERYPHITERICALWGHPELKGYLEGLVMIETNRDDRQGFPLPVQEELMALFQLIIDNPRLLRFRNPKVAAPPPSLPFSFTR